MTIANPAMQGTSKFVDPVEIIRALEGFEDPKVGDILAPSRRWENHQDTGELLPGICAFTDRRDALAWRVTCFPRMTRRFAILEGEIVSSSGRTVEPGEVVVRNARVVKILEFTAGAFREV
jgi:hypothetical protein